MTEDPAGPQTKLTPTTLARIVAAIGEQFDLDGREAELVKFTNNAVFRLPRASVVVRIAGSATMRARIEKVVQVARWLAAHGIPAVRLMERVPQPVLAEGHLATVWEQVPYTGEQATGRDLASILVRFHKLPQPAFEIPRWAPFDEIRQRLAEADGVDAADLEFLTRSCDLIEERLSSIDYVLPSGPIHGDAFLGNVLMGPGGPVICDFDSTCVGPREWDLTPVAVGKLRFDYATDAHAELSDRYGFDVTRWSGFDVLRQVRELKLVTSVVPILRSHPAIREQWAHRLQTFKRGDSATKWTTYS